MVRLVRKSSLVLGLLLLQYGSASAENLTPGLRLVRAHTREPWVTEIPVDMDLDGRDEILLISDHTKGGHETSFIQLHTMDDIFVAGPFLPQGEIQSVHTADLLGDGSRELIVVLRKPRQVIVADIMGNGGKIARTIDLQDDEEISGLLIEDLDGKLPLDFILAVTGSNGGASSRIIAYSWYSDRVLWNIELTGTCGPTIRTGRGKTGLIFLVPYRTTDTTGVHLIDGAGKSVGHLMLADNSAGDAHLSLIEQPFNESLVITSVPIRTSHGNETEISIWDISNRDQIARKSVHGVTEPVMSCKVPGTSSVVMGSITGSLRFYDRNLHETHRYRISEQNIEIKDIIDLDQDGVCEIIAVSEDSVFCFLPEQRKLLSFPGNDACFTIKQGFGLAPLIVVREGRIFNYLRLDLVANSTRTGMALAPFEIMGSVFVLMITGTLIGIAAGHRSSISRIKNLFAHSTAAYALVDTRNRIKWRNDSFRSFRDENKTLGSDSKTGKQSTKRNPRSMNTNLAKTGEFREWWGSKRILVTQKDATTEIEHILYEAWAHAVRELTARMRDALSTIRLGTQWIVTHRADKEKQSAHRERLQILLTETRGLQELTTLLANAASLSEKDHEKVCPVLLVRESIDHLPSRVSSRIHVHSADFIPLITAGKHQLGFAIHFLLSSIVSENHDDTQIDIRIHREADVQSGDVVRISIRCGTGEEMRVPIYVEALVHAVVLSCGGEMEVDATHEQDFLVELRFPVSDSR